MGRYWPLADMGCYAPGAGNKANWPPAPKTAFNLLLRMYAPESEGPTGKWDHRQSHASSQPRELALNKFREQGCGTCLLLTQSGHELIFINADPKPTVMVTMTLRVCAKVWELKQDQR
jgi:hypothetical protein